MRIPGKDESRQWGTNYYEIAPDHVLRYQFALGFAKGRVLDAACGCGYGSRMLSTVAEEVVGVDADEDAISWAKAHFPGPSYLRGRIEEVPWEGEFETVVSFETIEHIKEPQAALQAIRRACIGTFIASVPNEELYPFKAETFANDASPHYRHYTPLEFKALLSSAGFTVTKMLRQHSKVKPLLVGGTDGQVLIYVCS